jgi:hypothetical protein
MIEQLREETGNLRHKLAQPGRLAEQFRNWLRGHDARLGISLIGGTAIWALNFSGLNALNSLACQWGWFGAPAESSGLRLTQIVVNIVAAALIAGCGYIAYALWRGTRRKAGSDAGVPGNPIEPGELQQTIDTRIPFLAFNFLLLNVLYLIITLISLAPIAILPVCGGMT